MVQLAFLSIALLLPSCATPAGRVFPLIPNAPAFPPPPDPARITYLGQIKTDTDLHPAINGFDSLGRALFGKKDPHAMTTPLAVCTDGPIEETPTSGTGRIFVADSAAQTIHIFNLATRTYSTWTPNAKNKKNPRFIQPVAVAWDAANRRLLVSDSAAPAIYTFDTNGNFTGPFTDATNLDRPVGIAIDNAHQRVLIVDAAAHQLLIFSPDGQLQQRLGQRGTGPAQFNFPTNIALSPDGLIYIADSLNFRIQQFDPDLHFLRTIGKKGDLPGYFAQPKGIATDTQGHLYVIDSQFENIQLFNPAGQVLMDFGEEGPGPAQFWLPTSICITPLPNGNSRLIITDSYNHRLQFFDYHNLTESNP